MKYDTTVRRIFSFAGDCILQEAPYLASALHKIEYLADETAVDPFLHESCIHMNASVLKEIFLRNESTPQWMLLHMLFHIISGHTTGGHPHDPSAYDLACDLLVARMVRSVLPSILPISVIVPLREMENEFAGYTDPAEIASMIEQGTKAKAYWDHYRDALRVDDHSRWHRYDIAQNAMPRSFCNSTQALPRHSGNDPQSESDSSEQLDIHLSEGKTFRFAQALKKYTEPGEDPRPDPDAFQLPLYLYGLEELDTVIMEENEFTEGNRLSSFVIAIDTSGSCAKGLTARFLEMTRDILLKEKLFFAGFELYILQCDNKIRRETRITNASMFRRYIDDLQIFGGGGTDFRPIFSRVDQLITERKLRRLRGILVFSDGLGTFPTVPPNYGVTFAFSKCPTVPVILPKWVESVYFDE